MKIKKSNCSCDLLVELTYQTTVSTLEQSLCSILRKLLEAKSVIYFNKETARDFNTKNSKDVTIDFFADTRMIARVLVDETFSKEQIEEIIQIHTVYINQSKMINKIHHDQLTKIGNRQALEAKFIEFYDFGGTNKRKAKKIDYCLAILDIDHFKNVNDTHGHLHGDEVLMQLSQLMASTFRNNDYLFRYGGEEFVVILSEVDIQTTKSILERFISIVAAHDFPLINKLTVSVGATAMDRNSDATSTIDRADKALYFAKGNGRNQLHSYEDLVLKGHIDGETHQKDDVTLFN